MRRKPRTKKAITSDKLKAILAENIDDLKNDRIEARKANSICSNARAIVAIVRTELQFAKLTGNQPARSANAFLEGKS
jgi:hypothetical protein